MALRADRAIPAWFALMIPPKFSTQSSPSNEQRAEPLVLCALPVAATGSVAQRLILPVRPGTR